VKKPPEESFLQVRHIQIDADHAGQRVDNFLISLLKTVPRHLVYRLVRTGQVRVNKRRIKPNYRLSENDTLRVPPVTVSQKDTRRVPKTVLEALRQAIVFDDEHWIVINKPADLAVHAGSSVDFGVIDAIQQIFDSERINLVHRLDRATSGVMVLAKHRRAAVHFHQSLIEGSVKKHYSAILAGVLTDPTSVDAPLRKFHPTENENQVVVDLKEGKSALSHFVARRASTDLTLADVEIETGRTHQIRVHAASIDHPVLGDERYGDAKLNNKFKQKGLARMYLHARQLSFPDLVGDTNDNPKHCEFHVPEDEEWLQVLDN